MTWFRSLEPPKKHRFENKTNNDKKKNFHFFEFFANIKPTKHFCQTAILCVVIHRNTSGHKLHLLLRKFSKYANLQ